MPKRTLDQVAIKGIQMRPSNMIVRAFDGSKREVVGEISLPIQIGPTIFNVEFQVMDITPAYSCLLGRPWIHDAKAVPSTLHQKVKFIVGDKLVTVQAEDDILISKPSGLASFYRRFVPNFSTLASPLNELVKKDVVFLWQEKHNLAF
uniref:Uncharacterized protein n=1 Tax=Cajanus cajan TaxID=3821 RepID=A0A151QZG1_CAJCA|nr:hypothetical protein KK1_043302 [Cajanus cajan]